MLVVDPVLPVRELPEEEPLLLLELLLLDELEEPLLELDEPLLLLLLLLLDLPLLELEPELFLLNIVSLVAKKITCSRHTLLLLLHLRLLCV